MGSYPGDVDGEDYISRCPPPSHAQITIMGIAGRSQSPPLATASALRSFELKASVWDQAVKSLPFNITCFFPSTRRWENTKSPNRGALVSVTGEIIGVTEREEQLCVLIQSFDYISTRGTEAATNDQRQMADGAGPSTPKKNKWTSWGTPSPRSKKLLVREEVRRTVPETVVEKEVEEIDLVQAQHQRSVPSVKSSVADFALISEDEEEFPVSRKRN